MPLNVDLADAVFQLCKGIGEYRIANWVRLPAADRRRLEDLEDTLSDYHSRILTDAVGSVLTANRANLKEVQAVTTRAAEVIATIKSTQQVIAIGIGAVNLATAVMAALTAKDFSGAAKALQAFKDVVEA